MQALMTKYGNFTSYLIMWMVFEELMVQQQHMQETN